MSRILSIYAFCAIAVLMVVRPVASADDEADLKVLVEKFFALYAKKDLAGADPVVRFMALWSEKSPDYASRKQAMQQLYAANDYSFAILVISRVKVEAGTATLRATLHMTEKPASQPANQLTSKPAN